ncbi:MAG TPA: exo-beta-1,3-glucanase [Magnetospirillum sp.]|jgi:exo-beta-1,3-glucanase (GH17 family)|nr:exo-beta-1,3-glucanase [Magnetospirillum sp.]
MRIPSVLLLVAVTAFVSIAGWWWFNRPIPVALAFDEPFPSVSFAPFRRGQSPISKDYPPPAQIEEDLKSLVGVAKGVRTYTSREGMEVVPELGRKYGIEVTHSAWLGKKLDVNAAEVDNLIKAANDYPDSIKRVIVGNEVLLRQDLKPEELIAYIRKVKAAVKQPVSYADVWAFYLRYPEVAQEVDFITIHILPYWEDEPIGVEESAQHIVKIYRMMQEKFPGKPILIGEAGWPTRGRNRGPAAVNMESAALFVRTLAKVSKENGFDYNVVEAFDQPWKAKLEGTVGAFWGVVDVDRAVKFRMSGPVQDNPNWARDGVVSAVLGALLALAFLRRPQDYKPGRAAVLAAFAQLIAACVVWQAMNAWITRDSDRTIWLVATLLPGSKAWLAVEPFIRDLLTFIRIALHAVFGAVLFRTVGQSLREGAEPARSRLGEGFVIFYGVCAWAVTVLLFFNGRYRDIPNIEFLVPCVGVAVWGMIRLWLLGLPWQKAFAVGRLFSSEIPTRKAAGREMSIALLIAVALAPLSESLALFLGEDFQAMHHGLAEQFPLLVRISYANGEMLAWAAMLLVMALPFIAEWRLGRATTGKA